MGDGMDIRRLFFFKRMDDTKAYLCIHWSNPLKGEKLTILERRGSICESDIFEQKGLRPSDQRGQP